MEENNPAFHPFEELYMRTRSMENRYLSDDALLLLPFKADRAHAKEWKMRLKSANRFVNYIKAMQPPLTIMEIGCGNGWFSNFLAERSKHPIYGVDINQTELTQAKRVFVKPNLNFVLFDCMKDEWNGPKVDFVIFNASIQYFESIKTLRARVCKFLNPGSELHFVDSPFYEKHQLQKAQNASLAYYTNLGVPEMSHHYFHHTTDEMKDLNHIFLYKPAIFPFNKCIVDSPFPWIMIKDE